MCTAQYLKFLNFLGGGVEGGEFSRNIAESFAKFRQNFAKLHELKNKTATLRNRPTVITVILGNFR